MSNKAIIEKLKQACKDRDVRPAQLAKHLGYSKSYINMQFSGGTTYGPSEEFEKRANDWLGCCWLCGTEVSKWKKNKPNKKG